MSPQEPKQMLVQLNVEELAALIEHAVEKALAKRPAAKVQFVLTEAAERLGCKPSLLRAKVRSGEFPCHRTGRRVYFTLQDLAEIDRLTAVSPKKNGQESC